MKIDLHIQGDAELARALLNLVPTLERKVIRQALRAAARPVLASAKANVQAVRVTGRHTDALARGLKIRALRRKRGRFGVAVQTPTRAELGIAADARSYWPAHIELGTQNAPAEPYLRQALETNRASATAEIRQAILTGIERTAGKG